MHSAGGIDGSAGLRREKEKKKERKGMREKGISLKTKQKERENKRLKYSRPSKHGSSFKDLLSTNKSRSKRPKKEEE